VLSIKEPLKRVLSTYCDVNAIELINEISRSLNANDLELFKVQLIEAIAEESISVAEYERLTSDDLETPQDLKLWLIELWETVFKTKYEQST